MTFIPKLLLAASAAALFAVPLRAADPLLSEPFAKKASGESVPFGWIASHPAHVEIRKLAGTPYLRIWKSHDGGGSAAVYYTATEEGKIAQGQVKDFDARLVLRLGGVKPSADTTLRGIVFRVQSPTLNAPGRTPFWGYSLGVIATGERRGLYLFENPTDVNSKGYGAEHAFAPLAADLEVNPDYQLQVTAQGSVITASLLSPEEQVLATLRFDQAEETPGYFGLRAAHSNSNQNTYFRALTLTQP